MRKKLFLIICLLFVSFSLFFVLRNLPQRQIIQKRAATSPIPRGIAGDLWADVEVGRRDFTEIVPNEVVPNKLFKPEGVYIDKSGSPSRAYIWDSGNSRLLGLDLEKCYAQKVSNPNSACTADLVFGQPSGNDYGACNQDSSFQTYPNRPESSASTLCGISERTRTVREDGTAIHMDMDTEGNLYVPDALNNRILKYIRPWETDAVADEVWGQADFRGNLCNRNGSTYGEWFGGPPTNSTLCFCSTAGCGMAVTLDTNGNLWVADTGNNRVLRFSKNVSTGIISKAADLVLGRPDFITGGDISGGSNLNQMSWPVSLSFDKQGRLYIADLGNQRILVFTPPFQLGMSASGIFGSGFSKEEVSGPISVKVNTDPDNPDSQVIWTSQNNGWNATIKVWNIDGTLRKTLPTYHQPTAGQFDIDVAGNLLYTDYITNDVYNIQPKNGNYELSFTLFPSNTQNQISGKRLGASSWVGVAVTTNQLVVGDGRLLFWNNPPNLVNGQPPDGYIGTSSAAEFPPVDFGFYYLKTDEQNRVWVSRWSEIWVYQAPLAIGDQPIRKIGPAIPTVGGGEIIVDSQTSSIWGLAPTADGNYLWISQPDQNRVLRIKNPLTNPIIDIVLGQTDLNSNQCNRGEIGHNQHNVPLNMICAPGNLSFDRRGNFYVSDHTVEARGNDRLLMFTPDLFPANPTSIIFAPSASKEFPKGYDSAGGYLFETVFDSTNRMLGGYNPYSNYRFVDFFNDPTRINPGNPSDPAYATPNGHLNDYYGWPVAVTFDSRDNLYVYDANRGKVMIYKNPFNNPQPPTPTQANPTFTPTPASQNQLSFQIKLQGIDGQGQNKTVRVILQDRISREERYRFESVPVSSDANGNYSGFLTDIAPGTYRVLIKAPNYLQKLFNNVIINAGSNSQNWAAAGLELKAGDIWSSTTNTYHDNKITAEDVIAFLNTWTSISVDVPANIPADYNEDGRVNTQDVRLLLLNYNLPTIYGEE